MNTSQVLAGAELFEDLDAQVVEELAQASIVRAYAAGERLWNAGDPSRGLYLVLEGSVRVLGLRRGRQYVIHEEGSGGTLGEVPLFLGSTYPGTAVAASAVTCLVIPLHAVRSSMAGDMELSWRLVSRMAARIEHLLGRIQALATATVRARLAEWLWSRGDETGSCVHFDLTQEQLAEELGTVREVVAREMAWLRAHGIIGAADGGTVPILDVHRLQDIVEQGRCAGETNAGAVPTPVPPAHSPQRVR